MKRYLILYAVCATALLFYSYRRQRTEISRLSQNQTALTAEVEHYRNRLGESSASARILRLRCAEFEELRAADAERIRRLGIRLRRLEAAATTATATEVAFQTPLIDTLPPQPVLHDHGSEPLGRNYALREQSSANRGPDPVLSTGPDTRLHINPNTPHQPFPIRARSLLSDTLRPYTGHGLSHGTRRAFRWRDAWITVEGIVTADSVHCRVESIDTLRQIVHRVPHRFLFFRWGTKAIRQEISSSNPHTRIVWTEYIRLER